MIELDFSGMHVMVVGGTSGINRGIAESFASHNAKVSVASRRQEKVDDTLKALDEKGASESFGFACDVRDYEGMSKGIAETCNKLGPINVLVSGAAGNFPAMAKQMSANGFKSVMDIDVMGSFNVLHIAFDYLNKPGASVINISAPQSMVPLAGQSHVCAAKAGVDMLTKTLALEWAEAGVRVNSVSPGPIDGTEGMARLAPNEASREFCRQTIPLQRWGQPQDIANGCLFLASPLASFVTGVVLAVDGGWVLGGASSVGAKMATMLSNTPSQK